MGSFYETTFKIDIYHSFGAGISAAFYRYARENNIDFDDANNPIIKAKSEALRLAHALYGSSSEQVAEIKLRLDELKGYLYEVNPNAVI